MSSWKFRLSIFSIKTLLRLFVKEDVAQFEKVPKCGPLILVTNHVNFIDVPMVFTHLQPRPVTGLVKAESWDDPLLGRLFRLWGAIPIRRGEADLAGLKKGMEMLGRGYIVAVAPEGTRTNTGILKQGLPGVSSLALHSGSPLMPLIYYGSENYRQELKRLHKTEFHARVGPIFRLKHPSGRVTGELRQEMTDEIMYQLAELLPEKYRGVYADLSKASTNHLVFATS